MPSLTPPGVLQVSVSYHDLQPLSADRLRGSSLIITSSAVGSGTGSQEVVPRYQPIDHRYWGSSISRYSRQAETGDAGNGHSTHEH